MNFLLQQDSYSLLTINGSFETGIKIEKGFYSSIMSSSMYTYNSIYLFCFLPATSSDIQILMHAPNTKGVMLECHSRGWFPEPHMEWRDSNGVLIPATSKSHSQDENKIFTMKTSLLIEAKSHWNVTCYIQNPVTYEEESISVVLPGKMCFFSNNSHCHTYILFYSSLTWFLMSYFLLSLLIT